MDKMLLCSLNVRGMCDNSKRKEMNSIDTLGKIR